MKAKDTVMTSKQIGNVPVGLPCPAFSEGAPIKEMWKGDSILFRKIAKAQAEISFKAGFKEALDTVVATKEYDKGKQAGIKEVVDWIRKTNHSGDFYYSFDQAELEDQLKSWGL